MAATLTRHRIKENNDLRIMTYQYEWNVVQLQLPIDITVTVNQGLTGLQFNGARLTAIAGNPDGWGLAACTQPTLSAPLELYMSIVGPGEFVDGNPGRVVVVCGDAGGPNP